VSKAASVELPSSEQRCTLNGQVRLIMRFGIIALPSDRASLVETASLGEQLGYDTLYAADHLFAFFSPEYPFLDGWATLGGWAALTTRIRIGVLVANLSWRDPVQMARSVIALDQYTGGRFDLGVGAGQFADQVMAGMHDMPGSERIARLDEGLVVLDRLLRADHEPFAGQFTRYDAAQTAPGCIQRPRPPLIVAAHGPQALGVAARRGDVWSSYGGLGDVGFDDLIAVTRERGNTLSAACESIGRDPATIGRSLLVPDSAVDPWGDPGRLSQLVDELRAMSFDEIVFYWPQPNRRAEFERTSVDLLPQLR
jgi:alkanesulfonate monooxygenase SsuD/methylene tetrahydromethanopterin reductase-like flavin-dependent oxidoreductase (luciferase family)